MLPLSLGAHCPHLPPSYLAVGKPHIHSTININITNTFSGSSSFTHATSLSFLKMISVHLFCFTGTHHHVASVSSFPFSSLLRPTPVFHLKLAKEFSSESWTSHILELCLLHSLGIFFWNGVCKQEGYGEILNIQKQPQLVWTDSSRKYSDETKSVFSNSHFDTTGNSKTKLIKKNENPKL